jgi:ABC-2 type transport system permease protein
MMSLKTMKTLLVLVLIALGLVMNGTARLAVDRYSLKLDLTDSKLYQLSSTTNQAVGQLTSPVSITVFGNEQEYPVMLREMIAGYERLSQYISVSYQDPFSNPKLVDSFLQRGTRIIQNDLVIESGGAFRRFSIEDMYIFNEAKTAATGVRAEQQMTSAILQMQDSRVPVVRFTDGHNETPSDALFGLFSRNNYQTERITMAISPLDHATDLLVIASPTRDFSVQETVALDSYLNQGGSLMVFIAPSDNPLPNLSAFMERWGIVFGDGIVFEPRAYISDNRVNLVPMYGQHEINVYFGDKRYFMLMPSARPLRPADNPSYDLDVMTALSSTPEAYSRTTVSSGSQEKLAGDTTGPFSLAMTTTKDVKGFLGAAAAIQAPGGKKPPQPLQARIFAAGSASIYADDVLGMSTFANSDFLVQTINWLNPERTAVNIPAKTIAPPPLGILPAEAAATGFILTGMIPLLILATGLIVAIRRRRS